MDDAQRRHQTWLICLGLALGVLAAYAPLWQAGFIPFDDPVYVTDNPHIRDGLSWKGLEWAFTTRHAGLWHPLTWISYLADFQLYGLNPRGFHFTNLALHISNSILLFLFLKNLTSSLWPSALTAALFALHPMHVESVAWISERKDVLSTLFWILSAGAYARWVKNSTRQSICLASLCLFALGLMAKPMLVTLPFILLLLDYWPLQRRETPLSRLLAEKIPYLILATAASAATFFFARSIDALETAANVPWTSRLENIPVSYARYIAKTLWPADLAVMYPYQLRWPIWEIAGATALLILVTALVVRQRKRHPCGGVGWLWFLIMLAPVIGVVRVGSFAMADRYSYLSSTGLFIAIIWFLLLTYEKTLRAGAVLASVGCLAATFIQVHYWSDAEKLFRHALAVTAPNPIMENALGKVLFEKGQVNEALTHLQRSVDLAPNYPPPHFNLANALLAKGRVAEALGQYEINAALLPDNAVAQYVFGSVLLDQGLVNDAVPHLEKAVQLRADDSENHFKLAEALRHAGQAKDAISQYEESLRLRPNHVPTESSLAWLLATTPAAALRNGPRALELARLAAQATGNRDPKVLGILGAAYAETGEFASAAATATQALQLPEVESAPALARVLRGQLELYRKGLPFRDIVK